MKKLNGVNMNQNEVLKVLSHKTIGTFYFPYVNEFKEFQNQKVRHYEKLSAISKLDSLETVAVKPIEFQIKAQIPFSTLAIPVTYKLNNYSQENVELYVPKHENRLLALRQGAEDELTQIDSNLVRNSLSKQNTQEEADETNDIVNNIIPKAISLMEEPPKKEVLEKEGTKIIDLEPSPQLSQPIEYSPMHIFVSFWKISCDPLKKNS